METREQTWASLTPEQRELVEKNIGLVAVHLRRRLPPLSAPRRDREREDLFQEGCLGLMQAARLYQKERGIPFAAFALPRIHNAVTRAIHTRFSTVAYPVPRKVRDRDPAADDARSPSVGSASTVHQAARRERPKVQSLPDDAETRIVEGRSRDPAGFALSLARNEAEIETIGDRLGRRYERAVQAARDRIARGASPRGDRDRLAGVLARERYLIPREEARTPLREIARRTHSSYARVAQCDRQLAEAIRRDLEADPEFRELQRRARTSPLGARASVDAELDRVLARACAAACLTRFEQADSTGRARMFFEIFAVTGEKIDALITDRVLHMTVQQRERLWETVHSPAPTGGTSVPLPSVYEPIPSIPSTKGP